MTTKAIEPEKEPVVERPETVEEFIARCKSAQVRKLGYAETNPSVFKHFVGDQKTDYFWYDNLKVFVNGDRSKIEEKERKTVNELKFGEA